MNKLKKGNIYTPKVILIKEEQDVEKCLQFLQECNQIIINLSNCDTLIKYRIVDFLSGYVFALKGYREKLEENIYSFRLF